MNYPLSPFAAATLLAILATNVTAANVEDLTVDLDIFNGQGGPEVKDAEEVTLGAFTVANKNDTDDDGTDPAKVDNLQSPVPDEVDLMQMVIQKPSREGANDILTLKLLTGNARIWRTATKNDRETLPRDYYYSDLPKTVWVEAPEVSSKVRDIEFEIEYNGAKDNVKATGIWCTFVGMKKVKADPIWSGVQDPLLASFNVYGEFGPGIFRPFNPNNTAGGVHNGSGFSFNVFPVGVSTEPGIAIDVTRQIDERQWFIDAGKVSFTTGKGWPFRDLPNDDTTNIDEDVDPPNNTVYSIDFPGTNALGASNDRFLHRFNAREYVRIAVNGDRPSPTSKTAGSRASDKVLWHNRMALKSGPGNIWILDPAPGALNANDCDLGHITVGATP